jgi:electron transport complex protein RnfB
MGAIAEDGDRVTHNSDRCIGCGLCVTTCPSDALKLVRKPDNKWNQVPQSFMDTWRIITETQS